MYKNRIGVIFSMKRLLEEGPDVLFDLGISCIQLNGNITMGFTEENAEKILSMLDGKIEISSFWCGWTPPTVWNFEDGPYTLGLVPAAYRGERLIQLKAGADFAKRLGAPNLVTHVGFLPEQAETEQYRGVLGAVRELAGYCRKIGIGFNFETGQETPVTLMRTIYDIGLENLGINFDPANIILYGKGNSVDAIDIFGDKIRGVHVKDGDYPTAPFRALGQERVVGEGTVNYPVFLPKLLKNGYTGDLYIEREISGEQQLQDIRKTILYIKELMKTAGEAEA